MKDFYEYSTPELVRLLGIRFKEYRIRCNLFGVKKLADQLGKADAGYLTLCMDTRVETAIVNHLKSWGELEEITCTFEVLINGHVVKNNKEAISNITGNEIKSLVTGIENGLGFNN